MLVRASVLALSLVAGCATIDLGTGDPPIDPMLDEDFFYCRIQTECITLHSCAGGGPGDAGGCHASRSALRLVDVASLPITPPACDGDRVVGTVPPEYEANYEHVLFTVQSDPLSSPLYRRPTGLDSHPRTIFDESDPCAQLIRQWIEGGSS